MCIHLDKGETAVRLEPCLDHVTEVLEERNKIVLCSVWRKVANVAGGLPLRSLLDDHIIALDAMGRKMVMTVWRSWGHTHSGHCLLLGDGRLTFLVGPVAAYSTRSQPLPIHRAQGFLSVAAIAEGNETIATGATSFHVPHDACFRNGTKGRESLQKNLIVDFVAEITDKNVEMVRSVLLVRSIRLVSPIHANFLSQIVSNKANSSLRSREFIRLGELSDR